MGKSPSASNHIVFFFALTLFLQISKKGDLIKYSIEQLTFQSLQLKESGGEGNEEGSGGPKESTVSDDVGSIVPRRQVSRDGVTNCLHHRSEEG